MHNVAKEKKKLMSCEKVQQDMKWTCYKVHVKIKPYHEINDLEINKEVGHWVQCKGVEHGFMD
jgi:hypothetical protein